MHRYDILSRSNLATNSYCCLINLVQRSMDTLVDIVLFYFYYSTF